MHTRGIAAQRGGGGTIAGHVRLTGSATANPLIRMGADPLCGRMNKGQRHFQEYVLRAEDGGLANAFVDVQGTFPATPAPASPVTIDQRGCIYAPRVVGLQVGQTLQITNSDPMLHNLHSLSTRGNDFNASQPKPGMVFKFQAKAPDEMMRLKCDVHSWMTAWIGVRPHPLLRRHVGRRRLSHPGRAAGAIHAPRVARAVRHCDAAGHRHRGSDVNRRFQLHGEGEAARIAPRPADC